MGPRPGRAPLPQVGGRLVARRAQPEHAALCLRQKPHPDLEHRRAVIFQLALKQQKTKAFSGSPSSDRAGALPIVRWRSLTK